MTSLSCFPKMEILEYLTGNMDFSVAFITSLECSEIKVNVEHPLERQCMCCAPHTWFKGPLQPWEMPCQSRQVFPTGLHPRRAHTGADYTEEGAIKDWLQSPIPYSSPLLGVGRGRRKRSWGWRSEVDPRNKWWGEGCSNFSLCSSQSNSILIINELYNCLSMTGEWSPCPYLVPWEFLSSFPPCPVGEGEWNNDGLDIC